MDEGREEGTDVAGTTDAPVEISLNGQIFRLEARRVTGDELRQLPSPPVGNGYDLFFISVDPGKDDRVVRNDELLQLKNGDQFFATPSSIIAGR